jgi:arsenite methyltransferase
MTSPEQIKACCVAAYSSDAVALLLGDSYHPGGLTTLSAWTACVADARPLDEYRRLLTSAGLWVTHTEQHDKAVERMIDQIEARLHLARMVKDKLYAAAGIDFDVALSYVDIARRALGEGLVGYALVVAEKP